MTRIRPGTDVAAPRHDSGMVRRGKAGVLRDVLVKELKGVLGRDYFSAYRRYLRERGVLLVEAGPRTNRAWTA